MPKAIVIGAGFGGIAAALRLRKKGYDVTLLDKQQQLGGRGTQYRRETPLGTFIHDAGPTVVTAKFLFDELFELFGKRREDYIEFRDIFPWYRIIFAGKSDEATKRRSDEGSAGDASSPSSLRRSVASSLPLPHFDYGGTLAQMEAEIARFEPKDVDGFRHFLVHSKKIFDVGFTKLGSVPFHEPSMMVKCAPDLIRLESYKTVYQLASKYISNESLRRVFSFQPLLVGGNPFNTTSIYSLIFYLEREWGVQFAMGGTGAIVRGLEKLMREEGITIRLGEEVTEIVTDTGIGELTTRDELRGVFGVRYRVAKSALNRFSSEVKLRSGESIRVASWIDEEEGLVVANADAPHVWHHLIDKKFHSRKSKWWMPRLKYSMGLFVLYFGTKRTYPEIAHHTIVLGETYRELIDKLFDAREIETKDLSVYVHRPTATDPSMAPPGCESFYVLVPVPNLQPKKAKKRGTSFQPVSSSTVQHGLETHATKIPLTPNGAIDWAKYGDTFLEHVLDYLERTILPGLRENIIDPFYVTPDHFRDNLNSMHGAGFSIQPIFSQSAYFRFHNKAPGIEGLYFVGAGTHPGAGMPGVLCSAKVVESLVPDVKKD